MGGGEAAGKPKPKPKAKATEKAKGSKHSKKSKGAKGTKKLRGSFVEVETAEDYRTVVEGSAVGRELVLVGRPGCAACEALEFELREAAEQLDADVDTKVPPPPPISPR